MTKIHDKYIELLSQNNKNKIVNLEKLKTDIVRYWNRLNGQHGFGIINEKMLNEKINDDKEMIFVLYDDGIGALDLHGVADVKNVGIKSLLSGATLNHKNYFIHVLFFST